MKLTIACPATLRSDANNFAMVLGYGPADAETYVAHAAMPIEAQE